MPSLALYTTVFPGVERYLSAWHRSLQEQTDRDFQLWIGLDALPVEAAKRALGGDPEAVWVQGLSGDTPAQVRQRAFERIVDSCDAVVLVDSDDILHPSRVATARSMLNASELVGCALRLVDEQGHAMGLTFELPPHSDPEHVLPRNNVFGLSNSAFRSDLLRRCLPIPVSAALVDWFLVTRAWLLGATMAFSARVEMDYRQYGANTAAVVAPFNPEQVVRDTERVRHHFRLLGASALEAAMPSRLALVAKVAAEVEGFYRRVLLDPSELGKYVRQLNALQTAPLWWSSVAHPSLQHMWTSAEEKT